MCAPNKKATKGMKRRKEGEEFAQCALSELAHLPHPALPSQLLEADNPTELVF